MEKLTSKLRTHQAIIHQKPDRVPTDFLAVSSVWDNLIKYFQISPTTLSEDDCYDPACEEVLLKLGIDCRVISYDQFCNPPKSLLSKGEKESWWDSPNRSTPNRMWRKSRADGKVSDIWGRIFKLNNYNNVKREELSDYPLENADSIRDLQNYAWPEPNWWDFSKLSGVIDKLNKNNISHFRYRLGSVYETAWQLRGMVKFFEDMILNPSFVLYLMEKLTDIQLEIAGKALNSANGRIDMIYYYDDVATQESLMISKKMWMDFIQPFHKRICDFAHEYNVPVMYHCDGSVYSLIPDLIEMGIDVLNPIQSTAKDMSHGKLQNAFGGKICFHGGIEISDTLHLGSPADVKTSVRRCIKTFGDSGGYILSSTHHMQENTPVENILTMYDTELRY